MVLAYFKDHKGINILKNIETTKLQCYCEVMTLFRKTLGFNKEPEPQRRLYAWPLIQRKWLFHRFCYLKFSNF